MQLTMFLSKFGLFRQRITFNITKQFPLLNIFNNTKQISGIEREKFIRSKIHPSFQK
jgi:hypothetical protein